MEISFSTPIINLTSLNGYGYAGKNIVKSLTNLGHDVYFQNPKANFQINFSKPIDYKLHKNQYQISYTPWESTTIPEEWKPKMLLCDEIWTTSNWCAQIFEDNGFKNINVYPHGIDPMWKPKKRIQGNILKFLHIGEPALRKGGQLAVDSFIELFGNNPDYSLTLKVDKTNTTRVYDKNKSIIGLPYNLYNNIYIIDKTLDDEELLNLYYDHDVLLYPSYGEGFGFIPLQALATGMPTICTNGWAHYEKYLGPLSVKSKYIDSPWEFAHTGKVLEPNYQQFLEVLKDVSLNFKAYSGYYFAQSTKIHLDYNWDQLTKNSFKNLFKKTF
jgi:glycosyltransferase involved in cell wall biosynthesis